MTSLLKGFVGTLSDAFDINQSTLSGCIDIIVVEHNDGSRHSTPFHVRFGKLQLLRSREKIVSIMVNGERAPLTMKLGRAGEAYFYEEADMDTDGEWTASPMNSPVQSPLISPLLLPSEDYINEKIVGDVMADLLATIETSEINREIVDLIPGETPSPLDLSDGEKLAVEKPSSERSWSVWSWGWGSLPVRNIAENSDSLDPICMEVPTIPSPISQPAIPTPEQAGRSLSWVSSIFGIFRGRSDAIPLMAISPPIVDVRLFVTKLGHVRVQIEPRRNKEMEATNAAAQSEMTTTPSPIITPGDFSIPTLHCLELSLCAHLFRTEEAKLETFRANLITFERLCSDPAVIYNPNLMVRYQDLFYPGKAALPLIMSYLAFGKPLSSSALGKFQISTPISLVPSPPKSGFLHRWFGQDAAIREAKLSEAKLSDVKPILADPPVEEIPAASRRTLRPTCEMLKLLNLHRGPNLISFCVESALQGPQIVEGYIYLWAESARIVISDVDGTITRSDLLGNIMPLMGKDWSQYGVTSFFSSIAANGYNLLYLTSRAIGQANVTRAYLHSVRQGAISLPQGPVIMSPDSLIHSFKREVIYRRPQDFKIPALRDVVNLFPEGICPFVAGFGNRNTDIESYIAVGVPPAMIFIIDPKGAIHRTKSIHRTTYMLLNDQVEHMFPPFSRRESRAHPSYGEFHFWRKPIRKLENSEKQADQSADREEQGKILKADHLVGISLDSI